MIRRPPRSTLFPYTNALPICASCQYRLAVVVVSDSATAFLSCTLACASKTAASRCAPSRSNRSSSQATRSEEHTSELQSQSNLVCRLLLEKKKKKRQRAAPLI